MWCFSHRGLVLFAVLLLLLVPSSFGNDDVEAEAEAEQKGTPSYFDLRHSVDDIVKSSGEARVREALQVITAGKNRLVSILTSDSYPFRPTISALGPEELQRLVEELEYEADVGGYDLINRLALSLYSLLNPMATDEDYDDAMAGATKGMDDADLAADALLLAAAACKAGKAESCALLGTVWLFQSKHTFKQSMYDAALSAMSGDDMAKVLSVMKKYERPIDEATMVSPSTSLPLFQLESLEDALRLLGYAARLGSKSAKSLLLVMHLARFRVDVLSSDVEAEKRLLALAHEGDYLATMTVGYRTFYGITYRQALSRWQKQNLASDPEEEGWNCWWGIALRAWSSAPGENQTAISVQSDNQEEEEKEKKQEEKKDKEEKREEDGIWTALRDISDLFPTRVDGADCLTAQRFYRTLAEVGVVATGKGLQLPEPIPLWQHWEDVTSSSAADSAPDEIQYLETAAGQGDAMAARDLGIIHLRGDVAAGVPQDYEAAARYFQQAAEGGVGEAHVELANLHQLGMGVPVNYSKAVEHLEIAAKEGHSTAHVGLGNLYMMGDGVEANFTKAIHHYKAAADQGVPEAHANLGLMYLQGSGVDQDFKLARQHLHEAGSVGLSHAKFYLGHLLAGSFGGGERNCTQSVDQFKAVAETAYPLRVLPVSEEIAYSLYSQNRGEESVAALRHYMVLAQMGQRVILRAKEVEFPARPPVSREAKDLRPDVLQLSMDPYLVKKMTSK